MAKAQSFFGGTRPKETGEKARPVGNSSSTKGGPDAMANNRGAADHKAYKPKKGKFYRPNLPGKQDNRNQKIGNSV